MNRKEIINDNLAKENIRLMRAVNHRVKTAGFCNLVQKNKILLPKKDPKEIRDPR